MGDMLICGLLGVSKIVARLDKKHRSISAVRAAGPTAGSAHSATHLIEADLDAAFPCRFSLGGRDPTDPLVSRQRGDGGPEDFRGGVGFDGSPEV
jgi:hypothetical protein